MQAVSPGDGTTREGLLRLLINRNPFYLLSVAFVFHGSSRWFQANASSDPLILMALVGGFILLMAGTAFAIVRFGNVWDDARSIFVLLPVLFVELALAFDETLIFNPKLGVPLMLCGYACCVIVLEGLLLGLRIRLGAAYRLPMHLMLALMFLYPLTLLPSLGSGPNPVAGWQLFAFSVVTGLSVLSLLPALRRGREYVANNGTPWAWPIFPWVPVVFIAVGLCARAFAACVSFDPSWEQTFAESMKLQSVFAGYFSVPVLLAIGVLLLEGGKRTQWAGLCVPLAALWLAFPPGNPSVPQAGFLQQFVGTFGSPAFVCSLLVCAFYLYAVRKRVVGAGIGFAVSSALALVIGPETFDLATLARPNQSLLIGLTLLHVCMGRKLLSLLQVAFGTVLSGLVLHEGLTPFADTLRYAIEFHFVLLAGVAIAIVGGSRVLEIILATLIGVLCGLSLFWPGEVAPEFESLRIVYAAGVFLVTAIVAVRWRNKSFAVSAGVGGVGLLASLGRESWHWLQDIRGIGGLLFYVVGIVWFAIAVAVSVAKSRYKRNG